MKIQKEWPIDYNQLQTQVQEAKKCLTAIRGKNRKGSMVCIVKAFKNTSASQAVDGYGFSFEQKRNCPKCGTVINQDGGSVAKILRIVK